MLFPIILRTISTFMLICCVSAQWTSATFPDPRKDFIQCGLRAPGTICDPDGILTQQEIFSLERFIQDAEISSKNDINQPLNCRNSATGSLVTTGLQFFVVVFNKLDNNGADVTMEMFKNFTKELKARYNPSKNGECDKTILIGLSKGDGKLFTRASTDVQLSDAIFDDAFARNRDLFTSGQYAAGLTEMIAVITYAYIQAQQNALQMANIIAMENGMPSITTTSPLTTTTGSNPAAPRFLFTRWTSPVTTTVMTTTFATTSATLSQQPTSTVNRSSILSPVAQRLRATTVNGSRILSPAAQTLWLGVVIATFKFFSDQFVSVLQI